jgi:hypothetical protein
MSDLYSIYDIYIYIYIYIRIHKNLSKRCHQFIRCNSIEQSINYISAESFQKRYATVKLQAWAYLLDVNITVSFVYTYYWPLSSFSPLMQV